MAAPPGFFNNLKGTTEDSLQVGKEGPLLQRVAATARLRLSDLLRWLPGGAAVEGWIKTDSSGDASVVKSEFAQAVAPTVNDDSGSGYAVGSRWLDTTADVEYVCLDASVGAAVWNQLLTPSLHEDLDSLVHELSETCYEEITRVADEVTNITVWETSGKLKKVRETVVTRAAGEISQVAYIQYDSAGVELQRMTGVYTRAAGVVTSIAWTET